MDIFLNLGYIEVIVVLRFQSSRDRNEAFESRQHLVICRIIRDLVGTIDITNDSSNARKTCPPPRNNANVLVCVLGCLSLSISHVVEVSDSFPKFLNARRGGVLKCIEVVLDFSRSIECTRDRTNFWGTLTQVGPFVRGCVVEPIGLSAVGTVNDTGGTRMLDPRNGLLIGVDGLRESNTDSFHFMAS